MSMSDRDGKIWKDGKLIDWRDASIHMLTHSLHYGMAVFEGVRAYKTDQGTAIFRLREHTERLFNSAKIFQLTIPFDQETITRAQLQVVRENQLESCYLRPLVWIGDEKLGISAKGNTIHVAVAAWPWGAYLGEDGLNKGIRVKTSSFSHHHVNVSLAARKLPAITSIPSLPIKKRWLMATTKPCCWIPTATSRKARVKTSSS